MTPPPITHAFLVEKAASWLAAKKACFVVITDMVTSTGETPDAIGWSSHAASTLVEVKISRADFLSDKHKPHRRHPGRGMGGLRYYCAPKDLLTAADLPTGWGLLEWTGQKLRETVKATGGYSTRTTQAWDNAGQRCEIQILLSALRRIGQTCPAGISIKAYQMPSKNRATLGFVPLAPPAP